MPRDHPVEGEALQGVLFYLAAYGIMNAGAFGVLLLLPSRLNLMQACPIAELSGTRSLRKSDAFIEDQLTSVRSRSIPALHTASSLVKTVAIDD